MPDFSIEDSLGNIVAGIDEAGRGPWAGPVVAAAVILDRNNVPSGINDSKKVNAKNRERLFEEIVSCSRVGVGIIDVETIDKLNILNATKAAMSMAIEKIGALPEYALVDGNQLPRLSCKAQAVIKGDQKSLSIAAASIIAKVTRDRLMCELAEKFPQYGWNRNFGYGTSAHIEALNKYGITVHHRRSFAPIREIIMQPALQV